MWSTWRAVRTSTFTGVVNWVQIDLGASAADATI